MTDGRSGYEIALERIAKCKIDRYYTELDLSNLGLEEWPEELFELEHLEVLNLGSKWIYNKEVKNWVHYKNEHGYAGSPSSSIKNKLRYFHPQLKRLWALQQLNLDGNLIASLANLPYFYNLEILNLEDNLIDDMALLPSFPQLERLDLGGNKITCIRGNFDLPALRELDLGSNDIKVLENLSLFQHVAKINLAGNDITTIGQNNQLPALNHLSLLRSKISNLHDLECFPNLVSLDLRSASIDDLSHLTCFPKLTVLNLESCYSKKIPKLNLPHLRSLSLAMSNLDRIENLDQLPKLVHLDLSNNSIKRIENLEHLPALKSLDLGANEIEKIENLDHLPALNHLDLGYNDIAVIENLDRLPDLQELDLAENRISKIENLDRLPRLNRLVLIRNCIRKLENLENLKALTYLNLEDNGIEVIENLNGFVQLRFLNLSGNYIERLDELFDLPALEILLICGCQIRSIGRLDLPSLNYLRLGYNQIERLENLHNVPSLTLLDLCENQIQHIEPALNLPLLAELDLSKNQLKHLHGIYQLSALKELELAENQIASFAAPLSFPLLEKLDLSNNQLMNLDDFAPLPALKSLSLQENQIQKIHASDLIRFPVLETLILKNNPIVNLPQELLEGDYYHRDNCLTDLQQWFAELAIASTPNTDFKIIICGNGGVGKSRILDRLLDRPGFVHNWDSTHGIRIEHQVKPDPQHADRQISLNFWDFGGQTLYHAAHRLFMRYRSVYLVVWDPEHEPSTNAYSTDPWGNVYLNENLAYWVGSIHTQAESSPIVVFQNKVDEITRPPLEPGLNLLPASIQENCQIEYGSAKNALRIGNLQQQLLQAIQSLPEYGQMMPLSWMLVRDAVLQELHDADYCRNMISLEEFESLCREKGVLESTIKAKSLLYFLQRTGLLFYSSWYFADQIILNQQWAIDAIYAILDRRTALFAKIKSQQGVFTPADLFAAWAEMGYDETTQQLFFDFMRAYHICLVLDKDKATERYVLSMLLPESPDQAWQEWPLQTSPQKRAFIYQHPYYLHAQDMSSFLGDLLSYNRLIINTLWKNGVILQGKNPENQARISLDFTEKKILIETIGPEAEKFIQFIRYRFSNIYRSKMPLKEWASIDGNHFIDNEHIRDLYYRDEALKVLPGPDASSIDVKHFEWAKEWYISVYEFDDSENKKDTNN